MKKLIVSFVFAVAICSCEISQTNGPKVSEQSLKYELSNLCMIATVAPVRALSVILELGDNALYNRDIFIGSFTHPSANTWELMAKWTNGWGQSGGYTKIFRADSPVVFYEQADDSWLIEYSGDGMIFSYYNPVSYTTSAKLVKDRWELSTTGKITDKDGYEMTFGTTHFELVPTIKDNGYEKKWDFSINGNYSLAITKDGYVLNQADGIIKHNGEYDMYDFYLSSHYTVFTLE